MAHTYFKFHNDFLDWLCIENPYKNLRTELNLERSELAKLLKISPHTIRRYESENKAPFYYYALLRVLCGDLSAFGSCWVNCRIQPHNRQLKAPELTQPIYPIEFNTMYNRHAAKYRREADNQRRRSDNLENELKAAKQLNLELIQRIELLETQNAQLRALDKGLKNKKVVKLFKDF